MAHVGILFETHAFPNPMLQWLRFRVASGCRPYLAIQAHEQLPKGACEIMAVLMAMGGQEVLTEDQLAQVKDRSEGANFVDELRREASNSAKTSPPEMFGALFGFTSNTGQR